MESTDYLKMNVPGYSDAADIAKVSENFETLDNNIKSTAEELEDLKVRVSKLEKTAPDIKIISFTTSPKLVEKGDVVSVNCKWELSLEAVKTAINNISVEGTEYTDAGVGSNKSYNLYVEDERGKKASAVASVVFANRIYAGKSSEAEATASVIKSLENNVVAVSKNRTVVILANNQYVYYAYPKALGTSTFRVGMFSGGFNDPAEMVIENTKGLSEIYYIYRSTNKLTGTIELTVE